MPSPRMVTFSTASESSLVNSNVPSLKPITSPGFALMSAVCNSSCTFGPGRIITVGAALPAILADGASLPLLQPTTVPRISKDAINGQRGVVMGVYLMNAKP